MWFGVRFSILYVGVLVAVYNWGFTFQEEQKCGARHCRRCFDSFLLLSSSFIVCFVCSILCTVLFGSCKTRVCLAVNIM